MKYFKTFVFVLSLAIIAGGCWNTAQAQKKRRAKKANTASTSKPKSGSKKTASVTGSADGHEWIDLGLPSGTLWATMNVGANRPEDYGDYFAWGETKAKDEYNWATYKWCNGTTESATKYCNDSSYGTVDNKNELDPEDDAATANWGSNWQMPSLDQLEELRTECNWKWTSRNGVKGYVVTSKSNKASLFLPTAGEYCNSNIVEAGTKGSYWSRTVSESIAIGSYHLYMDSNSELLIANSSFIVCDDNAKAVGSSVRAVLVNNK